MINNGYLIIKDNVLKEATGLEYEFLNGYDITPKNEIKMKDSITVNKMLLIMPSMIDTLIKKKINKKIKILLYHIMNMDNNDDSDFGQGTGLLLNEAERLRIKLLNEYYMYVDKEYEKEMLEKIDLIERELKIRLALYQEAKEETIGKRR